MFLPGTNYFVIKAYANLNFMLAGSKTIVSISRALSLLATTKNWYLYANVKIYTTVHRNVCVYVYKTTSTSTFNYALLFTPKLADTQSHQATRVHFYEKALSLAYTNTKIMHRN